MLRLMAAIHISSAAYLIHNQQMHEDEENLMAWTVLSELDGSKSPPQYLSSLETPTKT